MKIALLGYGKMGKLLDELAPAAGMEIVQRLDIWNNEGGSGIIRENFRDVEVALDFSTPDAALQNIPRVAAIGVNLVVGTTGWHDRIQQVRAAIEAGNVGLVYGSNFSVGVNVFYRVAAEAARLLKEHAEYDPWIYEIHHKTKADAPSGTALKLRDVLAREYGKRELCVASARAGTVPGTHTVGFDSDADTITLTHAARNRKGFALGALRAAQWIRGKKGFYEFSEVLFG